MAPKVAPIITTKPVRGRHTGKAAQIRKLKLNHPELSDAEIAKVVGCNPSNVTRVRQKFFGSLSEEDRTDFQQHKAEFYDGLQARMLQSITDEEIQKTPVSARVISAGVLYDKAALTRGQATQINVTMLIDAVQMIREMRANPPTIEVKSYAEAAENTDETA